MKVNSLIVALFCVLCACTSSSAQPVVQKPAQDAQADHLKKIVRTIAKEPVYKKTPLWRKICHGPKSVVGSEYLGRIWSVVETCRQQGRGVWVFLTACMAAAADGRDLPSLLTLPNPAQAA